MATYHALSQWPWYYYSHPNIIVVLNWEGSVVGKFARGFSKCNRRDTNNKKQRQKKPKSERIPAPPACEAPRFSLPLLMNAEVIFVWGREQKGSLISTPFYLCPTAPASQPPELAHARVPQEAALHEGQRSGKKGKPLWSFSFTNRYTTLLPGSCFSLQSYNNNNKMMKK